MLQIVTGRYFRPGVRLNSTVHRAVLYTNRGFLSSDEIDLPVGKLLPSTGFPRVSTVTVSVTENLEAELPDGRDDILIATGGTELIDDLADVLSFALNAIFSRDHDLVHRLIPASLADRRSTVSKQLRGTFDLLLVVTDTEIASLREFMSRLLDLRRPEFEATMKAIRRIVRAWEKVAEDPTIAYTDIVAALESLSAMDQALPEATWQNVDSRKRKLIDAALEGADETTAGKVQHAVIEAERAGAKMRFIEFVLTNVSSAFYRDEAVDAIRPIRGPDLRRAVSLAYDIRSRNVHALTDLPPEAWVFTGGADTESPPGVGLMLSLEGLSRLARHVVRSYVASAPAGTDGTFNWRAALPGQVRMEVAPQYWVWQPGGLTNETAARYFNGFISHLNDVKTGRTEGVVNMNGALERIEQLAPGRATSPAGIAMIALYSLWHHYLPPENHRQGASAFLAKYKNALLAPSVTTFSAGLLTGDMPEWSHDQWVELASSRRQERETKKSAQPILPALDAALLVIVTHKLLDAGQQSAAAQMAAWAVEEMPGHEVLRDWEASIAAGQPPVNVDLAALILGSEPEDDAMTGAEDESMVNAEQEAEPPPSNDQAESSG